MLLLPSLGRAQKITDKTIQEDTLVITYNDVRAADCVSILVTHYRRLRWILATITTTNEKDSLISSTQPIHVSSHGRVDSLYVNGNYITLNDRHSRYQGGYLSEYVHRDKAVLWTRVYITKGNAIKEYAIAMEYSFDYTDE